MILETNPAIKPRIYQLPCIDLVKKTLEIRDNVLFVMAMGLGKTVTSAFIVKDWLMGGKRGLFLCHENYILKHVGKEYRKVIGNEIVYKTFYGGTDDEGKSNKDWDADTADMLFASFQSMNNWRNKWYLAFDPNHFDFMVVDESHHSQASSYREVIDYFQCKKIAMTATPDRMDLKDIREIFGEEVFTLSLEEGIANGWLAEVEYHVLSDGIDNRRLRKICKEVLEKGKRVSITQINASIFINERDKAEREIIAEYSKIMDISGNKKTLLFCEGTVHADRIITYFEKGGVMHSKRTQEENDDVFHAFERGDLQYVASVNKFNEGKHVPGVEVIVFLRATDSLTIFWQQLGRALAKNGTKTKVIVLDFVANLERLSLVRDLMLRVKEIYDASNGNQANEVWDKNRFTLSGKGFEFIFSDELIEIMKISDVLRKGFYETWQEASKATVGLGISSTHQYHKLHKKDLRLPSNPWATYSDHYPGHQAFFQKENYKPTLEEIKENLKAQGISDYWDLFYKFGIGKFKKVDFAGFESVKDLCVYLSVTLATTESRSAYVTYDTLEKLAEVLGWVPSSDERREKFKSELVKHGAIDYRTFIDVFLPAVTVSSEFGVFGKTVAFFSAIAGEAVIFNFTDFKKIVEKLGYPFSKAEKIALYKERLAAYGIKDYFSLITYLGNKFRGLDFGSFGKGISFASVILEKSIGSKVSQKTRMEIAKKLGWNVTKKQMQMRFRQELFERGIKTRAELDAMYPRTFQKMQFGVFGKGSAFMVAVLGIKVGAKGVTREHMNALAQKIALV